MENSRKNTLMIMSAWAAIALILCFIIYCAKHDPAKKIGASAPYENSQPTDVTPAGRSVKHEDAVKLEEVQKSATMPAQTSTGNSSSSSYSSPKKTYSTSSSYSSYDDEPDYANDGHPGTKPDDGMFGFDYYDDEDNAYEMERNQTDTHPEDYW